MATAWCSHCSKRQPAEQNDEGFLCCTWCGKIEQQNIFSDEPTFFNNSAGQLHKQRSLDANTSESEDSGGVGTKDADHDKVGADYGSSENEDDSGNFSDIDDDDEVDDYLHNEEEEYKRISWEEMNREYLEEQAAKEAAKEAEMEQRQKKAAEFETPQTAAEATHQMLKRKKLSSRVNYDVLKEIFDEPVGSDNTEKMRTELKSKKSDLPTIGEEDDIEAPKNADDYWGINVEEDNYYERSNAQDIDYYNEEEVCNYDNADDGSWL